MRILHLPVQEIQPVGYVLSRLLPVLAVWSLAFGASHAEEKQLHPQATPFRGHYWDEEFRPTDAYGSYNTILKMPDGRFELWNNTIGEGPEDGLVRFRGTAPTAWCAPEVIIPHALITDVFDAEGKLSSKRRYTRPFVTYHPRDGYFVVAHVCDGYPPRDGSVYPAWLASRSGEPGCWTYQGRLRGELEEYLPGRNARWADGGGLFYQPEGPEKLDEARPMQNRFLFFSNQYPGQGCLALLISADGQSWKFAREEGQIANLLPKPLQGKSLIFPRVVRAGKRGWFAWLSENWPPTAIWRIHSADGRTWRLFGPHQPEILRPEGSTIKTVSAWYDEDADTLHGFLSVWEQIGETTNYRLYHSTSRQFEP
ncbi:MAG: hypothetical protein HYU36_19635 [Planctomycetes bacterium]|nr:hypothetical protein [Planctomycetota bacterium]